MRIEAASTATTRPGQRRMHRPLSTHHWILVAIICLTITTTTTTTTASSAPWQDSSAASASLGGGMDAMIADIPPTIFSPTGRLPAVERVLQETVEGVSGSTAGTLVFALQCRNGIAVVTTVPSSPYLHLYTPPPPTNSTSCNVVTTTTTNSTTNSNTTTQDDTKEPTAETSLLLEEESLLPPAPFSLLTDSVWGVTAGNAVHGRVVQQVWHELASNQRRQQADHVDDVSSVAAAVLARKWADIVQHDTQHLPGSDSYGLLAVQGLFFSSTTESAAAAAALWRVDPSGQFFACRAAILGNGSRKMEEEFLAVLASELEGPKEGSESSTPPKVVAAEIRERLAEWTVEQALGVATDCIQRVEQKSRRVTTAAMDTVQPPGVRLQGVGLVEKQVTWYNATQLQELAEQADWSGRK